MIKTLINFDEEDLEIIRYFTFKHKFGSRSEFIRWLVRNYYKTNDYDTELKEIEDSIEKLNSQLIELNKKKEELKSIEIAVTIERENKEKKLKEAVSLISNKILSNKPEFEINDCARYWAIHFDMPIERLLTLAKIEADSSKL